MTLFDYPRPEDLLKPKVLVRLPDDPLFGPTRHGEDFSARYQDDGEIRLRGFERGLPQLDLDQQSAPKSPFSRGVATEDELGGDDASTKRFESTDFVGADAAVADGTGADAASSDRASSDSASSHGVGTDAMVADASIADEVDADSSSAALEADAAPNDETPSAHELAAEMDANTDVNADAITTEGEPSLSADGDSEAMQSRAGDSSVDQDAGAPESEKHLIGLDELEAIRREAYELGFQEGQAALSAEVQAQQAINAEAVVADSAEGQDGESADEAYLRGIEEGQQQARSELEAEVMLAADDWRELTKSLAVAARDAEAFHQPLLKLSMHLAEQMVRGELTLSGHAITRLVDRALSELQHESAVPIVVRMNPDDLQRFKAYSSSMDEQVDVRADPKLLAGSIRVAMNGSMIDDLIEHRRDALWQSLMAAAHRVDDSPPDSFLKNVAMVKEAMEAVDFGPNDSLDSAGPIESALVESTSMESVPVDTNPEADPRLNSDPEPA